MNPYRITQATLTTYSGKKVTVKLETDVLPKPSPVPVIIGSNAPYMHAP